MRVWRAVRRPVIGAAVILGLVALLIAITAINEQRSQHTRDVQFSNWLHRARTVADRANPSFVAMLEKGLPVYLTTEPTEVTPDEHGWGVRVGPWSSSLTEGRVLSDIEASLRRHGFINLTVEPPYHGVTSVKLKATLGEAFINISHVGHPVGTTSIVLETSPTVPACC